MKRIGVGHIESLNKDIPSPEENRLNSASQLASLLLEFGLSPDATEQEIRKQYRNYAK